MLSSHIIIALISKEERETEADGANNHLTHGGMRLEIQDLREEALTLEDLEDLEEKAEAQWFALTVKSQVIKELIALRKEVEIEEEEDLTEILANSNAIIVSNLVICLENALNQRNRDVWVEEIEISEKDQIEDLKNDAEMREMSLKLGETKNREICQMMRDGE